MLSKNLIRTGLNAARVVARVNVSSSSTRCFASASAAMDKLQKGLASELQFEKGNYEKPEQLAKLPAGWKLVETPGDVNMRIEKELAGNKICKIEWQLVSPFDPDMDEFDSAAGGDKAGGPGEQNPEFAKETDFTITIETKEGGQGMTYFCNTQEGESHRFIVGNVKTWTSTAERDNPAAYNGPDFEDLEDKLQEGMDEYLSEIGITDAVYDYIDAAAVDKEHREYMRWLENLNNFMKN